MATATDTKNLPSLQEGDTVDLGAAGQYTKSPSGSYEPVVLSSAQGEQDVVNGNASLQKMQGPPPAPSPNPGSNIKYDPNNPYNLGPDGKPLPGTGNFGGPAMPNGTSTTAPAVNGSAGTVTFINPSTDQTQKLDVASITPDVLRSLMGSGYKVSESMGAIPDWITAGNPDLGKANQDLANLQSQFQQLKDGLTKFTISDSQLQAQIQGITNQWDTRIATMQDVNARREQTMSTLGVRLGSQYTGGTGGVFGGIIAAEERQGVQRIADLESQKQAAIAAAQDAARTKNWDVYNAQLGLAEKAYTAKLTEVQALNKTVADENQKAKDQLKQASREGQIADLIGKGVSDPAKILATLNFNDKGGKTGDFTLKEITDTLQSLLPKDMSSILLEAAKNGATGDVLSAISKARTTGDMISAAAGYLTDPTSSGGMYQKYVKDMATAGTTPMSAGDFVAAQKYSEAMAAAKAGSAYKYQDAYNAEAGKQVADSQFASSDKNQQKLEQEYRQTLVKELSNRSGGLGLQDQKVNQAIHLRALLDQYKDSSSGDYNVPQAQYAELVLGLANLLSGTGAASEQTRNDLMSKTASGDIRGAIQYITGTAQNGNTQTIIKNLADSIDRQGQVAQQLRDQDVAFLQGLAPTDLNSDRRSQLENTLLPSYTDPTKTAVAIGQQANDALKTFHDSSTANAAIIDEIHKMFPMMPAVDVAKKLGLIQ